MTEIELLSKTETLPNPGEDHLYRVMKWAIPLGIVFMIAVLALLLSPLGPRWEQKVGIILISLAYTCSLIMGYIFVFRKGPSKTPAHEGSLSIAEQGLVFNIDDRTSEVKHDDIESIEFVYNGLYGVHNNRKTDDENKLLEPNSLTVKLRSGQTIDALYAIKDMEQKQQLREELGVLSKVGVKVVIRNTRDRAHLQL